MKYPLVLKISLGSRRDEASNEFYNYIEKNAKDIEIYKINERMRFGGIPPYEYIILVLGVTGSLASIASIFWMAWEKYKERKEIDAGLNKKQSDPKNENSCEDPVSNLHGPYIRIKIEDPETEKQIEILIDKDANKDIFIVEFTQKISALMSDKTYKQY